MAQNFNLSISPSNHLANASVSYKQGNPIVRFEIGESNRVLLPSSLRLVGKYHLYSDAARTAPVQADALETPSNIGVYATIDSLSFRTQRSKSEIETLSNYNRFMSTYMGGATTGLQDSLGHLNESGLFAPNPEFNKNTVVNNASTSTGNSFCVPLVSGFTSSNNPYPLYTQGVEVTIQLAPDSQVMFSSGTDSSAFVNGFYEFSDLRLICEVMDTGEPPSQAPITYEYNTITSFYNTINSTNAQISLNLGQSRVLGVFGSFVPTNFINNLTENGLATLYPRKSRTEKAEIQQLIFTRGGERFPFIYNIDTLQKSDPDDETADAQVVRNFLNAIVEFSKLNRTTSSPYTVNVKTDGTYGYKEILNGGSAGCGIGCALDVISGQGVDFSRIPFGIQMELDLDRDFPNALYLFVHSKQTLIISGQDIQVVQ
jgi:hypothetical protein